MSKSEKPKPLQKPLKGVYLSAVIGKEIDEVLTHFNIDQKAEIIEHLQLLFDELEEFFKTKDDAVYKRYVNRETELTKKYKGAFNPFIQKYFYKLFDFVTVLTVKGYYTAEEFNNLKDQENDLKAEDIHMLVQAMKNQLTNDLRFLYYNESAQINRPDSLSSSSFNENDEEMTESRQVLAAYYLFKVGFNIDQRTTHAVAELVPMIHLLTGKKLTKIQNSSIYDKLKQMPYYKKDQHLLSDLRYIKPFFEKMRLQAAVDMINEEIQKAIQAIDPHKRKDLR